MLVRRYIVKEMPEAVLLIRKDLGKDAVILSSKRIRVKKWLGLWHTKRIEVLAATGEDVPKRAPEQRNTAASAEAVPFMPPRVVPPDGADGVPVAQTELSARTWLEIQREFAEIRALLHQTVATVAATVPSSAEELLAADVSEQAVQKLLVQGVHPQTAEALVQPSGDDEDVAAQILSALEDVSVAKPIALSSRICAFVGPTGVGKTTTVAKIAALHVLSGTRKVGLITTDTYRIAAVEQLKTYASILRVPLRVVESATEFPDALTSLADCDLILVDTAGRSYRNASHVQEIQAMLADVPIDETFLVMSMTSKPEDLQELAKRFESMSVDKFLFTKLDETHTIGAMLTLLHQYRKPISYVTTGQNVPDDIAIPSLADLVRQMVEGVA